MDGMDEKNYKINVTKTYYDEISGIDFFVTNE